MCTVFTQAWFLDGRTSILVPKLQYLNLFYPNKTVIGAIRSPFKLGISHLTEILPREACINECMYISVRYTIIALYAGEALVQG